MGAEVKHPALNMREQGDFINLLLDRTVMSNGDVAQQTFLMLTPEDVHTLHMIARRLHLLHPHAKRIQEIVER